MEDLKIKIDELHEQNKHNEILALLDGKELDVELISLKARALNNLQKPQEAISELLKIEDSCKDDKLWWYRMTSSYYGLDDLEKTIYYAKKSLATPEIKTRNPVNITKEDIDFFTAEMAFDIYMYNRMYNEAELLLEEHRFEDRARWNISMAMAKLYNDFHSKGEPDTSISEYHLLKAIELSSDESEFREAVDRLRWMYKYFKQIDKLENLYEKYEEYLPSIIRYSEEEYTKFCNFFENEFGDYEIIKGEKFDDIDVDFILSKPREDRPYFVVSTLGMGALYMDKMPKELRDNGYGRFEILCYLPQDWDIYSEEEVYKWPFTWLNTLAKFPLRDNIWLGYSHTVPSDSYFASNTKQECILLAKPECFDEDYSFILDDEKSVYFLQMIPIYKEEMDYKLEKGAAELFNIFGRFIPYVIDPSRKNYCKGKGVVRITKDIWKNSKSF